MRNEEVQEEVGYHYYSPQIRILQWSR